MCIRDRKQNDASRVRFSDGCVQEVLTHEQALVEDLMLGMRMSRGVSAEKVQAVDALVPNTRSAFAALEEKGLVLERAGRCLLYTSPADDAILASGKTGAGIEDLLESIVYTIPAPVGEKDAPVSYTHLDVYKRQRQSCACARQERVLWHQVHLHDRRCAGR